MAGYSGKPLFQKLGLKDGMQLVAVNRPVNYWELIGSVSDHLIISDLDHDAIDAVHIFSKQRKELHRLLSVARKQMAENGMIWVSWPKKASRVKTDITEDVVRELAFPLDLVDVKVCAVDEIWSGLKLVIRKEKRKVR